MTGFFTFQVRAVDGGNNEAFADAQVVIIATENQIFLTFNNPIDYVSQKDAEVGFQCQVFRELKLVQLFNLILQIKNVFDSAFDDIYYTRDDIRSEDSESGTAVKIVQTVIRCHFLDNDSVPVENRAVNG